MQENNLNKSKSNKTLIIIIVLMSLVIVGLAGYIVYNHTSSKENNINKTQSTTTTTTKVAEEDEKIETKITKKTANEQLLFSVGSILYLFNFEKAGVNENIIAKDNIKLQLALETAIYKAGGIENLSEECYDGEPATGCVAIDLEKFKEHYSNLFGEKLENNEVEKSKSNEYFGSRDGKYFGSFPTGNTEDETILKATNIVETKKTIEVDVDVLKFVNNEDEYGKYYEPSITDYDKKYVVSNYKLSLEKNENGTHKIVSFVKVK